MSLGEGEAAALTVPESTGHTAALFCIEALGVEPPPDTGWVPREDKKVTGREGSTSGPNSGKQAEWYRNTKVSEWIYHTAEDMYYHLPTSSLWERRVVECVDVKVESHTYFRVDNQALQALSKFALSLDIGVIPLAFKAWVRYMRKTKKKRDPNFGQAPKEKALADSQEPDAKPASDDKASTSADLPVAAASNDVAAAEEAYADVVLPTFPTPARQTSCESQMVIDGASAAMSLFKSKSTQWKDDDEEALEPSPDAEAAPEPEELLVAVTVEDNQPQPKPSFASKDDGKRRGLFCLRCFRSSRDRERSPSEDSAAVPRVTAEPTTDVLSEKGNPLAPAIEADTAKNDGAKTVQEATQPVYSNESVERHMRKLESFLESVGRKPEKLIEHIEKRRQGKTTSLGYFVG